MISRLLCGPLAGRASILVERLFPAPRYRSSFPRCPELVILSPSPGTLRRAQPRFWNITTWSTQCHRWNSSLIGHPSCGCVVPGTGVKVHGAVVPGLSLRYQRLYMTYPTTGTSSTHGGVIVYEGTTYACGKIRKWSDRQRKKDRRIRAHLWVLVTQSVLRL